MTTKLGLGFPTFGGKAAALLAATLTAATMAAQASPVYFDFTATAGPTGPLAGVVSTGKFAIDSAVLAPFGNTTTPAFDDFDFTWNGIAYDETTANSSSALHSGGTLFSVAFGKNFAPSSCTLVSGTNSFCANSNSGFSYTVPGAASSFGGGTLVFQRGDPPAAIPEPASMALVGLALVGLAATRRRTRA